MSTVEYLGWEYSEQLGHSRISLGIQDMACCLLNRKYTVQIIQYCIIMYNIVTNFKVMYYGTTCLSAFSEVERSSNNHNHNNNNNRRWWSLSLSISVVGRREGEGKNCLKGEMGRKARTIVYQQFIPISTVSLLVLWCSNNSNDKNCMRICSSHSKTTTAQRLWFSI